LRHPAYGPHQALSDFYVSSAVATDAKMVVRWKGLQHSAWYHRTRT